nr:hypothetical protein [Tanacetum cinerariifolium]
MTTTTTQQVAIDNALVPLEKRVKIGKCIMRINPKKTQKEPTYKVILVALTTCYPASLITADVPEIYMHQFWFKIDKKKYKIDMEVFREIFQICPKLSNQEFDALPSDKKLSPLSRNLDTNETLNLSLMWKTTLVTVEKEEPEPTKKVAPSKKSSRKQSTGVQIRDTPIVSASTKKAPTTSDKSTGIDLLSKVALLEEARVKKVLKRNRRETTIHQAGGSADHDRGAFENQETNDDEEESDNKFVHTPKDYVPTDDETNNETKDVDEEEYDKVDKELYGDVNTQEQTTGVQEESGPEMASIQGQYVRQGTTTTTPTIQNATTKVMFCPGLPFVLDCVLSRTAFCLFEDHLLHFAKDKLCQTQNCIAFCLRLCFASEVLRFDLAFCYRRSCVLLKKILVF